MKKIMCFALALLLFCTSVVAMASAYHTFGEWHYRRDGVHKGICIDCSFLMYAPCCELSAQYEGSTLTVCPVCGHFGEADGTFVPVSVTLFDYAASPEGDPCIYLYRDPLGAESTVKAAFSVVFEKAGQVTDYSGRIALKMDVSLPEDFRLIKCSEVGSEEIESTYTDGMLNFIASDCGSLYLIVAD